MKYKKLDHLTKLMEWLLYLPLVCLAGTGQAQPPILPSSSAGTLPAVSTPSGTVAAQAKSHVSTEGKKDDNRYRIGPGDLLNIQIFNRPQLSRDAVRVDGRGMIQLPWIDTEIQVACRTEMEVAAEITTRYRSLLRSPQVSVFVKEFQSQPVAVIGAVNQPGRYQLQRPIRLLELLTFAGGPAERAGRSVQIIHTAPVPFCEQAATATAPTDTPSAQYQAPANAPMPNSAAVTEDDNLSSTLSEVDTGLTSLSLIEVMRGNARANPWVRPGDIVTLPDADQIFVVGNVLRPAGFPLRAQITVSQAVAMAGGLLPASKTDRVSIVRQTPTGKNEIFVDLKAINKRQAEDVVLQANDIVNIPTAAGKSFLRTVVTAIAPAVSQLPVQALR